MILYRLIINKNTVSNDNWVIIVYEFKVSIDFKYWTLIEGSKSLIIDQNWVSNYSVTI